MIDDEIRLLTISTFSSLTTLLSQFHHTNNIIISHNLPSQQNNQDNNLSQNLPSHDLLSSCQIYYQYSVENYSIHLGEIISYNLSHIFIISHFLFFFFW